VEPTAPARPLRRADAVSVRGVTLGSPAARTAREPQWSLAGLSGLLTELSSQGGAGVLSLAFSIVLDAQALNETVAWITDSESSFFPPDAAASGVDLDTLTVIRLPGVQAMLKGADRLVRCGAFGLVVLDLGASPAVADGVVSRLAGLAERHDTAVLCLTEKRRDAPSLGARVALRAEARRRVMPDGRYACTVDVFRDRRQGRTWSHEELLTGPEGLS
jgi:recombination protein RecA